MKINCNTGVNIPQLPSAPCNGIYTSDLCITHEQSITALNLPINSTVNSVVNALVLAIQYKEEQIQSLTSQIAALTPNYTSYVFNVTQIGTNIPVITELVNTTGKTFIPTRASTGLYYITPNSSLGALEKIETLYSGVDTLTGQDIQLKTFSNLIRIRTNTDGVLENTTVRINIYP